MAEVPIICLIDETTIAMLNKMYGLRLIKPHRAIWSDCCKGSYSYCKSIMERGGGWHL